MIDDSTWILVVVRERVLPVHLPRVAQRVARSLQAKPLVQQQLLRRFAEEAREQVQLQPCSLSLCDHSFGTPEIGTPQIQR